jgi:hypothetical protein
MHPSKAKGNAAEREAAALIHELLGFPVKRRYNLGSHEDIGDLIGLPDTVVQVVSRSTDVVAVGLVRKPIEAEVQAHHAGATFAATFVRIRGGTWRVVLTPEQFACYWREATGYEPPVQLSLFEEAQ